MSVTYGFYDSNNGDRQYTVDQISAMFDGFFTDGVFRYYGNAFSVSSTGGMNLSVESGKAWFDHRYITNDSPMIFTIDGSDEALKRVDAIVIEINANPEVRENSIKVIKGDLSSSFVKPTLVDSDNVHQYAIAYIYVEAGVDEILDENIEYVVGSQETPYSNNIILDSDNIVSSIVAKFSNEYRLNVAYPVGSIYISTISSNPSSYLGGTWEQIKGRFLVASGTVTDANGETATFYAGTTGGEYVHRLSLEEMPSHTHPVSVDPVPAHSHTYKDKYSNYIDVPYFYAFDPEIREWKLDNLSVDFDGNRTSPYVVTSTSDSEGHTHNVVNMNGAGEFSPHNNLPPYLSVYVWKRIA